MYFHRASEQYVKPIYVFNSDADTETDTLGDRYVPSVLG